MSDKHVTDNCEVPIADGDVAGPYSPIPRVQQPAPPKETSLPPDVDGQNENRAAWALAAIRAFQTATGTDDQDAVADLLCDLQHFCDRMSHRYGTFAAGIRRAEGNYAAETGKAPY